MRGTEMLFWRGRGPYPAGEGAVRGLSKMVEKFATGVVDTGSKFATSVVDTGGGAP
jgi:hypothetical protein